MPFAKLFRSRWAALLWAAGIIWTAYDVAAGTAPTAPPAANTTDNKPVDATGTPVDKEDLAVIANLTRDAQ